MADDENPATDDSTNPEADTTVDEIPPETGDMPASSERTAETPHGGHPATGPAPAGPSAESAQDLDGAPDAAALWSTPSVAAAPSTQPAAPTHPTPAAQIAPRRNKAAVVFAVTTVIATAAAAVLAVLWIGARSDADELESELEDVAFELGATRAILDETDAEYADAVDELVAARSERDNAQADAEQADALAEQAQAEAEAAAATTLPEQVDVLAVLEDNVGANRGYDLEGDDSYAVVEVTGTGLASIADLEAALEELGFPGSIGARIGNTRALDGTLTADGDGVTASWSYHPDSGLTVIVERTD